MFGSDTSSALRMAKFLVYHDDAIDDATNNTISLGGEDPDELFSLDQSLLSGADNERDN